MEDSSPNLNTQPQPQISNQSALGGVPVDGIIPYKNMPALLSYYFGVFGLIPFLGIPLSIVAIVLGIFGLKFYKKNPSTKGKAHSITGIVLGTIEMVFALAFVLIVVFAPEPK